MTRLRVAAGYFSQFHLQGWRAIPGVELVGWADKEVSRVSGVRAFAAMEEMLAKTKPDVVDRIRDRYAAWRTEMDAVEPRGPFRDY